MKLQSNHVLVRLTKKTDEIQIGEVTMDIETVYDEERHQRLVGIIVYVPKELFYENLNHSSMPWECEMEAMIGDEVILRRTDVSVSRGEGKSFEQDGHLFIYVPYHSLILVKRKFTVEDFAREFCFQHTNTVKVDEEYYHVIMLNGYMLLEQDETDLGELILPDNVKESKTQTGRIAFIGKPNKSYHEQFNSAGDKVIANLADDKFDLKVGDKISFVKYSSIDIEFDMHRTFAGKGVHFVRMQRNKVLCKV